MAKTTTQPAQYDAGQIQVLKGLEAVRKRPGMYIGSTSERGLHHLVYEVVDNSIDEALAGYATHVEVTIHADNSITVVDDGRGIPVDIHPVEKIPGVELALTVLHAGGKFDKSSYKVSGGLHGVGVSVVNALAEKLKVWVRRDGQEYYMDFVRGGTTTKLKSLRKLPKAETGTTIWFKPDPTIFTELVYQYDTLASRLRELSFLNKGVAITLTDEREEPKKVEVFLAKGGLKEFVTHLNSNRKALHNDVVYIETVRDDIAIEVALQYNDGYSENVFSFVNNINTHEGGTHLTGFKSALTRVINVYATKGNWLKKDNFTLTGDDVREGLTAVLSIKVHEPQFEGQTKTKLGNSEAEGAVKTVINEFLAAYLEEHPKSANIIVEKAVSAARMAARKAREQTRRKGLLEGGGMPGKLSDCSSKDPSRSPVPIAWISVPTSLELMIRSKRARSTLRILPRSGRIAWYLLSRPDLAEPPALSPSTRNSSHLAGSRSRQSLSLPGRLATLIAPLRLISRARRAASRAAAASTIFWMICFASPGFSSSHSDIFSPISASSGWRTSEETSLSLVCDPNLGSGSLTETIAVRPSRMSSPVSPTFSFFSRPVRSA